MSGSQHNPNGRQSQLGAGWSPLQLQMANLLARAPQAHMASDRGVTWHTPTPPPHLYHVPAPSPPDPLQAMKNVGGNSVFRHTATPPDLYRHTPTPPDKHLMSRHTPSPGDVKAGAPMPPADLYPHLGPARDKLARAEEQLLAYARVGVDLSLGSRANGSAPPPAPAPPPHAASPALSVRDAPTINSLIARAAPRRVDALLERLAPAPAPASPHSVIVHPRVAPTPSPPSSNEDSADSFGAAPGSKRKRKPERTVRVPAPPPPTPPALAAPAAPPARLSPPPQPPVENGDTHMELEGRGEAKLEGAKLEGAKVNGPEPPPPLHSPPRRAAPPGDSPTSPTAERRDETSSRRKTRSGSAETIADIAAMIADGGGAEPPPPAAPAPPLSVDKLKSVLASPEPEDKDKDERPQPPAVETAAAPSRRSARTSNSEAPNVPVASPSEAKPAEPEAGDATAPTPSFVEVENQLEKMFAGLEEEPRASSASESTAKDSAPASKRRKSAPGRGREAPPRRRGPRKKPDVKARKPKEAKEGYDSGSNASSGRSRGPYIQIRGPRESPVSVCVMNAATGEEETEAARRRGGERRRGLHASTLGLRYDAATRDLTWLCAFCARAPHADALGDLFGPYTIDTDCDEYRCLDEASRRRHLADNGRHEVWLHAECGVWAPGVVAGGARVWGLARAVWAAAAARCRHCARAQAPVACAARACPLRAHLPCARQHGWRLSEDDFRALCPQHAPAPAPPAPSPAPAR